MRLFCCGIWGRKFVWMDSPQIFSEKCMITTTDTVTAGARRCFLIDLEMMGILKDGHVVP